MPWNEEIRATWARMERLAASPTTVALVLPLVRKWTYGRCFRQSECQRSSCTTPTNALIAPATGKYVADHIPGAKYVELPGRNMVPLR